MTGLELLALLVFGHVVGDYPMQGQFIALGKNRTQPLPGTPWYQILTAHAIMHGGLVAAAVVLAALSGYPCLFALALPLAVAETACHWAIDDWKCRREARCRKRYECEELEEQRIFAYDLDQALHLACKITWAGVCVFVAGLPLFAR
ncbi:DUF3307 domain-containing protein [Agrobacterium rubi]|nr:DUF3307 domain-containing protein [Agrobacterium rubi]NTF24752.1 DUF3307 domain-containing protein [Agrobacterium rubi]